MADLEPYDVLKRGPDAWNAWREDNSYEIDLTEYNLKNLNLRGANLNTIIFYDADLRGCDLSGAKIMDSVLTKASLNDADLTGAQLAGSSLDRAFLSGATLVNAEMNGIALGGSYLDGANLTGASLYRTNLFSTCFAGANLTGADVSESQLVGADLSDANLTGAKLARSDARGADFLRATLVNADLRSACLQNTRFDDADISGALLWETQRAGWSINGVICENAFWDEKGQSPTIYTPGEFEKLHSSETCIELRYPGGLSTFELSTLPALIYHLSQQHGSATISLKSVEQTGGGAKVTLSLGDADTVLRDKLETDATQLLMLQLKAREDETLRLHDTLRQMHETTIRLMLAAGAPQTHFHGPVHTAALASGNARVEVHQTFNDSSELVKLIDRLLTGNTGLTPAQAAEVEGAKAELEKGEPQRSRLNRFYEFLKSLPKEAVLKGVGKLGEKATETDWASLLRQMGEFIHHVH